MAGRGSSAGHFRFSVTVREDSQMALANRAGIERSDLERLLDEFETRLRAPRAERRSGARRRDSATA